jgi:hypothetical protein
MPVVMINGKPVALTMDELIEYESKTESSRATVAQAAYAAQDVSPRGHSANGHDITQKWTAALATKYIKGLGPPYGPAMVALAKAAKDGVSSDKMRELTGAKPKGIGSIVVMLKKRAERKFKLPSPVRTVKAKDRTVTFYASDEFRAAVEESGMLTG